MNIALKQRTAFRKRPLLYWSFAGLLLLSGLLVAVTWLSWRPTVSGTVLLDGEPLPKGRIRFVPIEGTSGGDGGDAIREGKYSISKGLREGKYKVEIQGMRGGARKMRDPVFGDLIDAEETIKFAEFDNIVEIAPGHNPCDFDLKEARKRH
jgi:hypothetical protein